VPLYLFMFTIKFDEAIITDSQMDNFYTTGPGKQGFIGILMPTIYHSNGHRYAYLVFPGGVVCYVEKAAIHTIERVDQQPRPKEPERGVSETTLLKALAISQDPTLALQLVK
jgi:hypothetical protein